MFSKGRVESLGFGCLRIRVSGEKFGVTYRFRVRDQHADFRSGAAFADEELQLWAA